MTHTDLAEKVSIRDASMLCYIETRWRRRQRQGVARHARLDIERDTAERIIDALAVAIDGKPSSAKSFNQFPYEDLADYGNWGQDNNDSKRDTAHAALFMAYLVFSGGRIPLRGIEMHGTYFRPDVWVAGALVKKGYLAVDESAEFVVTQDGWSFVADTLEVLGK
ncbi:hypothetical protein [Mesorhizobium sp. M1322]|uniref:hypothetical protein n=1 Tax=Mesorhizobium sp. M1322 TaxID=2957081 RepID=UPI003338221A